MLHDTFFLGVLPLPNSSRPDVQFGPTQNYHRILVTEFGTEAQPVPTEGNSDEVVHGLIMSGEKPSFEFFQHFLSQV